MDKNDIIEYVMNTPHNTNKAVLNSMLNQLTEGGGGDSSDFSIAKLTANLGTGGIYIPLVFDNGENAGLTNEPILQSGTYDIPLYKGVATGNTDVEVSQVTVTGNATYDNDTLIVTGDCTVTITEGNGTGGGGDY